MVCAAALATAAARPHMDTVRQSGPELFTVQSDGHPMAVWARVPPAPVASLLLVHGRTWSSRPDFDLQVRGMSRSVMSSLAGRGIAAYAVDLRGYGSTPRDATGWLTPKRAAADVANVLRWVSARHSRLPPAAVLGWSRGAAIAMLAAQTVAPKPSALILFGLAFDPAGTFVDAPVPARPQRVRNTREDAVSDFIAPGVTSPAVVDAFVTQALRADPVRVDLRSDAELNAIDPARITMPTLILYGDRDPAISHEVAAAMLAGLAAREKEIVVLPGGDHAAQLEDTHEAWVAAVTGFVIRPTLHGRGAR